MAIYIRPFEAADLKAFVPIEPIAEVDGITPELAAAVEKSGLSVTGVRDDKIVGCGGVHPTNYDGQGELWLRLSKDCLEHRLDILRWLRDGLRIIEEIYPFKQLNATIRDDFAPSIRLVKFFGFSQTQSIKHNGRRWLIFSKRVKEW